MTAPPRPPLGILLLTAASDLRKSIRRALEGDGHAVLAVSTIGDAVARVRSRHYELVVCVNRHNTSAMAEDYALLIDERGQLARSGAYELYLPGIGIDARAVLLVPVSEPEHVRGIVSQVVERLDLQHATPATQRTGFRPSPAPGKGPASALADRS